jgi:hypothetical protein
VPALQKRAYRFLSEIKFASEDGILPFVLRVACDSVQNLTGKDNPAKSLETSDVLSLKKGKLDHVIYKVCEREEAKYEYSRFLGRSSVDAQCLFFIQLALVDRGQCTRTRMQQFFKNYSAEMTDEIISRLAGHPLLDAQHNVLVFAYDVVSDFFLTLGFHRGITGVGGLEFSQVEYVADRCQINSPFLEEVAARIEVLSEDIILTNADYVADWYAELSASGRAEEYYRCASALFNSGLQFLSKRHPNDLAKMTDYLMNVFRHPGDDPALKGVALHNIPENAGVRFDFSGLSFERASIVGYEDFLKCKFNAATRFRNSRIKPGSIKARNTSAIRENFVDSDLEGAILDSINRMVERRGYQVEDAKMQLRNFLRIFRLHGSFHRSRQVDIMRVNFHSNTGLSFKDVQEICQDEGLVEFSGSEIGIVRDEIENVETFIHERLYQGRVQKCIGRIFEKIR